MPQTKPTFDSECLDLADHFLQDEEPRPTDDVRYNLARSIQAAVEDWFHARGLAEGSVDEGRTGQSGAAIEPTLSDKEASE